MRSALANAAAILFCVASLCAPAIGEDKVSLSQAPAAVTFERQILPILQLRCVKCHGDGKLEGGLDLRRRAAVLSGGESGPAVIPGKASESLLLEKLRGGEMPPKPDKPLTASEKSLICEWIQAGAVGAASESSSVAEKNESWLAAKDRLFWAFLTPVRPIVPQIRRAERARTPVDRFLLAKLDQKGLSFNVEASRSVLLRRLSFDLLGLPPTPEQLDGFLEDRRPDAYERLVDRLLASPHYGERWARHWLDVAGYADSDGYLDADRERPEAWRYRDYVINAMNADLPFDRFLVEQLAGDELSNWRRAGPLTADMVRQLTATGFLRTALDPTNPMYNEPNEIHQVLSDTLQIVGSTCLGLTVQCARCHSHKFDPISQRDYYSLQAVFLPALDPARWQPSPLRGIPLATAAEHARVEEANRRIDKRIAPLKAALLALTKKEHTPNFKKESEELKAEIAAVEANRPALALLRGLADLDDPYPSGRILKRGDFHQPGAVVEANVPACLMGSGPRFEPRPREKSSGRRLALARWLTDPAHPLTARVQVNRLWAHHFGRGLVATVANFGHSGARPSHPELLDWLATELHRQKWSLKALHRLIVISAAYRQTADGDAAKAHFDSDNILLGAWQPRRFDGETLRDSVMAVADDLNVAMLGPPAHVLRQPDGSVLTGADAAGRRRSIYLQVRRSQHLTLLDLFDTPKMEINCPERTVSTVPLQSLAMLHGPFAEQSADALANRILKSADTNSARLVVACRLLYSRGPHPAERAAILAFVNRLTTKPSAAATRAAWMQVALVLLNSNAFVYIE
jgi:hypothetical protein